MVWVSHESGNQAAIYSEVVNEIQTKTLTVSSDLSSRHILEVKFIEVLYIATADAATRVLELLVVRDALVVHSLRFDSAVHPTASETKRIFLSPFAGAIEAAFGGAADNHVHVMMPIFLAPGDAMTIRAFSGGQALDDMHLFVHARMISNS